MVSPVLYENFYTAAFLVSEAEGWRSRSSGVMQNGGSVPLVLQGGLVVNQNTAGSLVATAGTANVGNGTIGTLSLASTAVLGVYTLTAISATDFTVTDPNNVALPNATVGTAYTDEIDFTLTAGTTAFAAGDSFTLNAIPGDESWVPWTGGTISTLAILFNLLDIDANGQSPCTLIARDAEVNETEVQFDPAVTSSGTAATLMAQAFTSLATSGVIARKG
jgi:hypothetical protein